MERTERVKGKGLRVQRKRTERKRFLRVSTEMKRASPRIVTVESFPEVSMSSSGFALSLNVSDYFHRIYLLPFQLCQTWHIITCFLISSSENRYKTLS